MAGEGTGDTRHAGEASGWRAGHQVIRMSRRHFQARLEHSLCRGLATVVGQSGRWGRDQDKKLSGRPQIPSKETRFVLLKCLKQE